MNIEDFKPLHIYKWNNKHKLSLFDRGGSCSQINKIEIIGYIDPDDEFLLLEKPYLFSGYSGNNSHDFHVLGTQKEFCGWFGLTNSFIDFLQEITCETS